MQTIETYEEACQAIGEWGMLPLSGFIPEHPSLEALTRPQAWHTGLENDPWLWRDRLPAEGVAAYGRFLGGKPLLVSRELFPLLQRVLTPEDSIEERYRAGKLARATRQVYEQVSEHDGIDVKALRKQTGMQDRSEKTAFVNALTDLQASADILICGISERLNEHGNKSGWNSTCYMLADHWMQEHNIAPLASSHSRETALAQLIARLEPHWQAGSLIYLRKKLPTLQHATRN